MSHFPYFAKFEDGWPIRAILYGYLGNSTRRLKQLLAEESGKTSSRHRKNHTSPSSEAEDSPVPNRRQKKPSHQSTSSSGTGPSKRSSSGRYLSRLRRATMKSPQLSETHSHSPSQSTSHLKQKRRSQQPSSPTRCKKIKRSHQQLPAPSPSPYRSSLHRARAVRFTAQRSVDNLFSPIPSLQKRKRAVYSDADTEDKGSLRVSPSAITLEQDPTGLFDIMNVTPDYAPQSWTQSEAWKERFLQSIAVS